MIMKKGTTPSVLEKMSSWGKDSRRAIDCKASHYGCIDPSGMIAPWSDLASLHGSGVTLAPFRLAPLKSAPVKLAVVSSTLHMTAPLRSAPLRLVQLRLA